MGGEYADEVYGERDGHCDAVADEPPCLDSTERLTFRDHDEYFLGYWRGYEEGQSVRRRILKAFPPPEHEKFIAAYLNLYQHSINNRRSNGREPPKFLEHLERWNNLAIPRTIADESSVLIDAGRLQPAIQRLVDHYHSLYAAFGFLVAWEFKESLQSIRYANRKVSGSTEAEEAKRHLTEKVREWIRLHQA